MSNYKLSIVPLLVLTFLTSCFSDATTEKPAENQAISLQKKSETAKSDSIHQIIAEVVNAGNAPGMIAAVISGKGIMAIASAGERKVNSGISFTTDNVLHLGSCGKAMTATMLATLIADGKLRWDTKLIEAIPELKNIIHKDYHEITLARLLTHRAGLPQNWESNPFNIQGIKKRRLAILESNLREPAPHEIDTFHYSNFGYVIAACMAEHVTGLSWENLMKKRLFEPLGMSTAGLGNPNKFWSTAQPWGHNRYDRKWRPSNSYFGAVIGPAGRIHCNISDWAKFITLQLDAENPILERKYLDKLIEPVDYYASGWFVTEYEWAKGTTLIHGGTNRIWYTLLVITPKLDRAFVVATNSCSLDSTPGICSEVINKLISMELKTSIKGNW